MIKPNTPNTHPPFDAATILAQIGTVQAQLQEMGFTYAEGALHVMQRQLISGVPLKLTFTVRGVELEIVRMLQVQKRSTVQYAEGWAEVLHTKIKNLAQSYSTAATQSPAQLNWSAHGVKL